MNTENQELKRQLAEQNNSWNARRIRNELTAGIIQGESMGKIANRFYSVMGSNRKAAVRNARTAVTSAQNGGRMDAMRRAMEQGYSAKKQWVSTMDERTRLSHILLGGETVDANKPFSNGLMYPGDPDGDPSEVYNCRCTMVDADDRFRTAQDDELDAMYQAWKAEKLDAVAKSYNSDIMESDLGKFKKRLRADDRITKEYYAELKETFSHGADDAKKMFEKFVPPDSVENSDFEGTARFNTRTKKISMHYQADLHNERGACATWFHEHGHLIDDAMGSVSNSDEFMDILREDAIAYRKNFGKVNNLTTWDKIDRGVSVELNDMRRHSAVSDIFEGVTNGNVSGVAGHRPGYWDDDSNITSEAFAHMFEAQFDKTRYEEMKKYFPNGMKYFEALMKEALK